MRTHNHMHMCVFTVHAYIHNPETDSKFKVCELVQQFQVNIHNNWVHNQIISK